MQKSLSHPFRRNLLLLGSGWRAFYAPYNATIGKSSLNSSVGTKILDLTQGPFTDAELTGLGFFDLGWIRDFAIADQGAIGEIRSGYRGMIRMKIRGQVGEKISFRIREFTRMAMKIASGTDVYNLLENSTPSVIGPISASGAGNTPVNMVSYNPAGATGPELEVAAGQGVNFPVGCMVVVDKDYNPSVFGLVGENATPVLQGSVTDVDYIRKTSDFMARVKSVNGDILTLSSKLVGGGSGDPTGNLVPQAGSKVQRIVGWTARKGGMLVHEWSAVFVLDTEDSMQMVEYYPHLAISQSRPLPTFPIDNIGTVDYSGFELDTEQEAIAFEDPIDGQPVVGYRVMYPVPKPATSDVNI